MYLRFDLFSCSFFPFFFRPLYLSSIVYCMKRLEKTPQLPVLFITSHRGPLESDSLVTSWVHRPETFNYKGSVGFNY